MSVSVVDAFVVRSYSRFFIPLAAANTYSNIIRHRTEGELNRLARLETRTSDARSSSLLPAGNPASKREDPQVILGGQGPDSMQAIAQ